MDKRYMDASARNVTPMDGDGCIGIGLTLDGGEVVRLRLSVESIVWLFGAVLSNQHLSHSDISTGISKALKSSNSPVDGCKIEGTASRAKSSAAKAGES